MQPRESIPLPKPPPPRSPRREAAIEAALRRFDGIAEPSKPQPARRYWNRHPQIGLAMAASLILVIGIPAAFIVIEDRGSSPAVVSPSSSGSDRAAEPSAASNRVPQKSAFDARPTLPPAVVSEETLSAPAQEVHPVAKVARSAPSGPVAEAVAPPPAAMAYAPPPPPAPPQPTAPMLAQKSAEQAVANDVVVTGSRIPRPNSSAGAGFLNRDESSADQMAPDWVLKDRAYATFLTRLQTAVRTNDRGAVMKLIRFPLRVNANGHSRLYPDARSVQKDYDRIFTPRVAQAILGQRFDRLFGRDLGLMIGDGEVWFDHVCLNKACSPAGPVRITAVNS
jgi:hypothetical protein